MTESSDDSVDTVISALDSHLLQSPTSSHPLTKQYPAESTELCPEDCSKNCPDHKNSAGMGNILRGERKRKDEGPPEKKPDDNKPKDKSSGKKKGKKSKNKSKRNSQAEGDSKSGDVKGACVSPSKSKWKRPDVLADLGSNPSGSPLSSPVSASGSLGTCSFDEESDVSTLGYSTPLLSTPQVKRYVMPHNQEPQQTSTERLDELNRSIEKAILDNASDRTRQVEGATASGVTHRDKKQKRKIKKKRDLGQAVLDSFTLPVDDSKPEPAKPSAGSLNVGSISLRESRESPVSPWLRDDDMPIDEEQMDEMFISCIDISYNLADICSEREFTEYGSLDSKKPKPVVVRPKESSLSPSIARRLACPPTPTQQRRAQPVMKPPDSRDTPPKSDSSTSTLADTAAEHVVETAIQRTYDSKDERAPVPSTISDTIEDLQSFAAGCLTNEKDHAPDDSTLTSETKSACVEPPEKERQATPEINKPLNIPSNAAQAEAGTVQIKSAYCSKQDELALEDQHNSSKDSEINKQLKDDSEKTTNGDNDDDSKNVNCEKESDFKTNKNVSAKETPIMDVICDSLRDSENIECSNTDSAMTSDSTLNSNIPEKTVCPVQDESPTQTASPEKTDSPVKTESLSPQECASPKHVPPPSPSAMDALAEIDEDDEEAIEAIEGNSQAKEVQLFGEIVLKRLSSLVESQSQDEDIEERMKTFDDEDDDTRPVDLGSMADGSDIQTTGELTPTVVEEQKGATGEGKDLDRVEDIPVTPTGAESKEEREVQDEGTLKKKKRKKSKKDKANKPVVKRPDIPAELKQVENSKDLSCAKDKNEAESEKENAPPKRESQQIDEVIEAYGLTDEDTSVSAPLLKPDHSKDDCVDYRPRRESDGDSDSFESLSSGRPSRSSLELSRGIPDIEETFNELLSVKHILDDLEDRTPTEERIPSFISSEGLRSPPDFNGRRSRMSPAVTERTESDLDISEQRDDISTDSMYADDEDEGASEVLFSRSYSEPAGNEVVVSCTFYNTQHCNNAADSDDFWEDYTTADESFKQIEISADAASSTFNNARKQMHDIHQHLQDLRRQMEQLQDDLGNATLTSDYSLDSEDKRIITE